MMHLYVFGMVGSYCGGAVGVFADTPERARELATVRAERFRKERDAWHNGDSVTEPEPFFAMAFFVGRDEAERLGPRDRLKRLDTHFVLKHYYPIADSFPDCEGIAFAEDYED